MPAATPSATHSPKNDSAGSPQRTNPQVRRGALGGIRTPNLLIRSQMLYPLSYERLHPTTRIEHRDSLPVVGGRP
jgi:hypothetical protein